MIKGERIFDRDQGIRALAHSRIERTVEVGGHGHFGMTGGPPSGRLVCRLINGQEPGIDPAPYAASRFR
jgi:glycine/D-amino acid oxidase-like deaminating enzyme